MVAFEHLRHELLHQVLAAFPRGGVARQPAFLYDLVEQAGFSVLARRPPDAAAAFCGSLIGSLRPSSFPCSLASLSLSRNVLRSSSSSLSLPCRLPRKIRTGGPQFQKLAQRFYLPRHVVRREIVHALEMQVDFQVAGVRVFAQLVLHRERQVRLHRSPVPASKLSGLTSTNLRSFKRGKRFYRLSGEIPQNPHDER